MSPKNFMMATYGHKLHARVYTYTHTHTFSLSHTHTHTHACLYARMHACTYTDTHTHTLTDRNMVQKLLGRCLSK